MTESFSSVKGTFPPPRSRGISMKRGLVRASYGARKSNAVTHLQIPLMTKGPGRLGRGQWIVGIRTRRGWLVQRKDTTGEVLVATASGFS